MEHTLPYPPGYIEDILSSVKSIAVVGASPKSWRPSNQVTRKLIEAGYDVYPVNPGIAPGEILGRRAYASLADIGHPVDMVDVFREPAALGRVADQAVATGAGVLWFQLGLSDSEAARRAESAGLRVVMNRCPKIELGKLGR